VDLSLTFTPELAAIFATLFVLELVLGVDNVIFISILAGKLPREQQNRARLVGLSLAMVMRIGLVLLAGWLITLKEEAFAVLGHGFSWKDVILVLGGAFLVYKAVSEIHHRLEGVEEGHAPEGEEKAPSAAALTFRSAVAQILALDIVFSLDSVITAVGMTDHLLVIIAAVVVSFAVMMVASRYVFAFVNAHPTVKMLALAFLLLIGVFLVAEGFGYHVDKAFVYGPMAFAVLVEGLNLTAAKRAARRREAARAAVRLRSGHRSISEPDLEAVAAATTRPER